MMLGRIRTSCCPVHREKLLPFTYSSFYLLLHHFWLRKFLSVEANHFCASDSLCEFPPKSVKMKKPFAVQPWIDSENNVGNLLMVCFSLDVLDMLSLYVIVLQSIYSMFSFCVELL